MSTVTLLANPKELPGKKDLLREPENATDEEEGVISLKP